MRARPVQLPMVGNELTNHLHRSWFVGVACCQGLRPEADTGGQRALRELGKFSVQRDLANARYCRVIPLGSISELELHQGRRRYERTPVRIRQIERSVALAEELGQFIAICDDEDPGIARSRRICVDRRKAFHHAFQRAGRRRVGRA